MRLGVISILQQGHVMASTLAMLSLMHTTMPGACSTLNPWWLLVLLVSIPNLKTVLLLRCRRLLPASGCFKVSISLMPPGNLPFMPFLPGQLASDSQFQIFLGLLSFALDLVFIFFVLASCPIPRACLIGIKFARPELSPSSITH